MTIADAPWIRDAENNGWGPEGEDPDFTDNSARLKKAEELIYEASEYLENAADELKANTFFELMDRASDLATDIRVVLQELERGHVA
jgi:hypothetical protein